MATTKKQVEALALWRVAEGKSARPEGPRPTRRQIAEAQFRFAESVASGEILPQLLPAIRRTLTARYDSTPQQHQLFTTRKTVQAINTDEEVNVYSFGDQTNIPEINAGDTFVPGGLPTLLPREPYPQIGLTATGKKIRARKIGEAFGIDWEAIIKLRGTNINLIRDGVNAFGRHAANQEDIDVARLLVKSTGFATAAGEGLNGAVALTGNPDLTDPVEMQAALAQLLNVQIDGILPNYEKFVVVTSVANAPAVRQGIAGRRIVRNPGAQTGYSWEETVDFGAEVEVVGWKWLTAIWPGIGKGAVIIPVASEDELPVLTSNYLEGYEAPSFWVKDSNARNISGGEVNPELDGDFDSDAVVTKVRHVHGANSLWNNAIGYTTGAGA